MNSIKKKKIKKGQLVLHIFFLILTAVYLIPFLMVLSVSFTSEASIITNGYSLWPKEFSLAAYKMVFSNPKQILRSYEVTFIFTAVSTALAVFVMGVMAYPLSRPNYKYGKFVSFYVFFNHN